MVSILSVDSPFKWPHIHLCPLLHGVLEAPEASGSLAIDLTDHNLVG
jgi:hypothetical protein